MFKNDGYNAKGAKGYNALSESRRTTFEAITNALQSRGLLKKIFLVREIWGENRDSGDGKNQFRLSVLFVPGTVAHLTSVVSYTNRQLTLSVRRPNAAGIEPVNQFPLETQRFEAGQIAQLRGDGPGQPAVAPDPQPPQLGETPKFRRKRPGQPIADEVPRGIVPAAEAQPGDAAVGHLDPVPVFERRVAQASWCCPSSCRRRSRRRAPPAPRGRSPRSPAHGCRRAKCPILRPAQTPAGTSSALESLTPGVEPQRSTIRADLVAQTPERHANRDHDRDGGSDDCPAGSVHVRSAYSGSSYPEPGLAGVARLTARSVTRIRRRRSRQRLCRTSAEALSRSVSGRSRVYVASTSRSSNVEGRRLQSRSPTRKTSGANAPTAAPGRG